MDPEATDPGPQRRATDLPPDSPWYVRWFVANVKEAYKWASVQWAAIVAVVAEVYALDPADVQHLVGLVVKPEWWPHVIAGASLFAVFLRVTNLKGKP